MDAQQADKLMLDLAELKRITGKLVEAADQSRLIAELRDRLQWSERSRGEALMRVSELEAQLAERDTKPINVGQRVEAVGLPGYREATGTVDCPPDCDCGVCENARLAEASHQPDTLPAPPDGDDARAVTVCSECFSASCWHGEFMCDKSREVGTVEKTVAELRALNVEHPDNYSIEKVTKVCGSPPEPPKIPAKRGGLTADEAMEPLRAGWVVRDKEGDEWRIHHRAGHDQQAPQPGGRSAMSEELKTKYSHYYRDARHLEGVDVYRVLLLFGVVDPALQHALKKILVAGGRGGGKDITRDVQEAIDTLERWKQMRAEDAQVRS